MYSSLFGVGAGIFLYFCVVLVMIAAGLGMQRLFFSKTVDYSRDVLLAPITVVVFLFLVLGILVGAGVPVCQFAYLVWGCLFLCAVGGIGAARGISKDVWLLLVVSAIVPVVLLWRIFFVGGLFDAPLSINPDGWSYMAYGEYIWSHVRGVQVSDSPLYAYADHLNNARYISRAMLSLFRPLTPIGDTRAVASLLYAVYVFVLCANGAFLARALDLRPVVVGLYVVLLGMNAWLVEVLWIFNYDNLAALLFFPFFVGTLMVVKQYSIRHWIGWGLAWASLLFAYPELSVFVFFAFACTIADMYCTGNITIRQGVVGFGVMVFTAIVFFAPTGYSLLDFAFRIFLSSQQAEGIRPGEGAFVGLLQWKYMLTAFWGYGGQHCVDRHLYLQYFASICASLLAVIGGFRIYRRGGRFITLWAVLCLIGVCYWVFIKEYDYAAYKMILLLWWFIVFCVVVGGTEGRGKLGWRYVKYVLLGGVVICQLVCAWVDEPSVIFGWPKSRPAKEYRDVQSALSGMSVGVAVENVSASLWALYNLRDNNVNLLSPRSYMQRKSVLALLTNTVPLEKLDVMLFDSLWPVAGAVGWSNNIYKAIMLPHKEPLLLSVRNNNGLEPIGGELNFWMNDDQTVLECLCDGRLRCELSAVLQFGGNMPIKQKSVRIQIDVNGESVIQTLQEGLIGIPLELQAGLNVVVLNVLDLSAKSHWNTADTRTLLVRLNNINLSTKKDQ